MFKALSSFILNMNFMIFAEVHSISSPFPHHFFTILTMFTSFHIISPNFTSFHIISHNFTQFHLLSRPKIRAPFPFFPLSPNKNMRGAVRGLRGPQQDSKKMVPWLLASEILGKSEVGKNIFHGGFYIYIYSMFIMIFHVYNDSHKLYVGIYVDIPLFPIWIFMNWNIHKLEC